MSYELNRQLTLVNLSNDSLYFFDTSRELFQVCYNYFFIFIDYVYTVIGIVGFLLNFICFLVFMNNAFYNGVKSKMFKYLLYKSLYDGLIHFFKAISPFINCELCSLRATYLISFFDLFVNKYFIYVCTLCSIFFELAAQLDRLITISQHQKFNNFSYKIVVFCIITFISGFYTFKLFEYDIRVIDVDLAENFTQSHYHLYKSSFSYTLAFHRLNFVHSILRDIVCVVLLLLLDILILIEFRRVMKNKKNIMHRKSEDKRRRRVRGTDGVDCGNCPDSGLIGGSMINRNRKVDKAENKTTIMILIIGLMTLIGRFPIFFNYLPIDAFNFHLCFQFSTETLFFINISLNFFIYYFFNKTFKIAFKELFYKVTPGLKKKNHVVRKKLTRSRFTFKSFQSQL